MKLGRIRISNELLKEDNIHCLAALFAQFIPVSIDKNQDPRSVYYYGFCESFEEVKEGFEIPEYSPVISFCNGVYKLDSIDKI